ncbi:MAG: LemA family protein [Alphaproteobacteria bacterium]
MAELLAAGGGAAALVVIIIWWITLRRRLGRGWERVRDGRVALDECYRRRADMIPRIVDIARAPLASERDTLASLRRLRARSLASRNPVARSDAEDKLSRAVARILAAGEASHALRGRADFEALRDRLVEAESAVLKAETAYSAAARDYNELADGLSGRLLGAAARADETPRTGRQAAS